MGMEMHVLVKTMFTIGLPLWVRIEKIIYRVEILWLSGYEKVLGAAVKK